MSIGSKKLRYGYDEPSLKGPATACALRILIKPIIYLASCQKRAGEPSFPRPRNPHKPVGYLFLGGFGKPMAYGNTAACRIFDAVI